MNEFVSSPGGIVAPAATEEGPPSLREVSEASPLSRYLRIARRWRWIILGSIAMGIAAALIITLLTTRQYSATVKLEIAREQARIVNVEGVQPQTTAVDQEFYQTQYGLLKSRSLAERVVRELRLTEDRAFLRLYNIGSSSASITSERPLDNSPAARQARQRQSADVILGHIEVSPVRLSRLVDVTYTSPDPALSARIANAWGQAFIQSNIERRFETTAYARTFLEGRLRDLRQRLDESERALVAYAADQRIINVTSSSAQGVVTERPITGDDLVAYNNALAVARADRIAAESALRRGGQTAVIASNATVSGLRQRRAEAAAELARLSAQFGPAYPQVEALSAQVRQLDQSLGLEERRVGSTVQSAYQQAVGREQDLARRVEGLKGDLIDLRRRSIQYNILQREVDTSRSLYDGLLQRYKEIGVAGAVGANNISIIDLARVPTGPSTPRPLLNVLLGLLIGAVVGATGALALEQTDEAITDPEEMERALGVPSLGVVPLLLGKNPLEELQDRRSPITEAYLTIKTNLQFATPNGIPRLLLVTSTKAGEGKSTTALALATILVRQGLKVVMVDSDMRSPSLHGSLGISNEKGLSSVLSGNLPWNEVIQDTDVKGLKAIAAGPHPPNAADLLSGPWVDKLFAELSGAFDHVVIDAPPLLGLADAALLASKAGGVVYVVEAFGVHSRAAKLALDRLRGSNAHLLGVVLTKFQSNKASYGYGYDYGYGYGQSQGDRDGQKG